MVAVNSLPLSLRIIDDKAATNAFEPNDSSFYALQFPNMTSTTTVTVPGSLNTPIDNDWFSLYVANISEFASLEIVDLPASTVVESYTVSGGKLMIKTGSTASGNTLPITAGYNYFRIVSTRSGAFSPIEYKIKFCKLPEVWFHFFQSTDGFD